MTCLNSSPPLLERRTRCATHRDSRGFTLTEILVVILMIAILSAVAAPSFLKLMRDTTYSRMTMQIAEVYRKAYIESAEQSTYLVRWTGGNTPKIELVKATLDSATPELVSPHRCNSIDWTLATHIRQTLNFKGDTIPKFATVGYLTNTNQEVQTAQVCYAHRRTFVRYSDDEAFVEMPGAGRVYVKNMQTNVIRRVLIPSFGLPRLIQ